ncbi:efflux RND transporter periplasmic adaptor subunit [Novosphingobium sp. KN65.2]|uniref:efflux RND transporter periplasmic adaptor subunit n=1 Tax=Novosphingobium sp. KN65.2 TaxID=1478134 RepID=UPI0005E16048|nr:efflux RND transporter periplasmic adaptor subunit [Novosphingobium sp. KN65.2]CDO38328.1 putative transporter [Novosphingobium sp. KN65.2]
MIRHCTVSLLLILAACSGSSDGRDSAPTPVALVTLATASKGNVAEMLTLYGAVQADSTAQYALSAPVEAIVRDVAMPVGSAVQADEVVVRLEPSPNSRAAMASAAASARAAEQAYARARRLRADGLASDGDVESARSAAITAQAQQDAMTRGARSLLLRAQEAGHVETVSVNPGDLIAPGSTVATLTRFGSGRARFGIDPQAAMRLAPGTRLQLGVAGGGTRVSLPIENIDRTVDPQTRLASVYARIPARLQLGPGQPLTARVPLAESRDALTIPYQALLDDGGQPYVYVVKDGIAHRHDVVLGSSDQQRVAVTRGIAPGDKVITVGGTAIEDGMKVRTR